MKRNRALALLAIAIGAFTIRAEAQDAATQKGLDAITTSAISAHVGFLASPLLEGRYTSERGAALASEYIATMFTHYGVSPAGDRVNGKRGYFQSFDLYRYSAPTNQRMSIESAAGTVVPTPDADYLIANRRLTNGFSLAGEVVYVGYGLCLPELGIDSYGKQDIKGKLVVVLPLTKERLMASPIAAKGLSNEKISSILNNQESELTKRKPAAIIYLRTSTEIAEKRPHRGPVTSSFDDVMGIPAEAYNAPILRVSLSKAMISSALKQSGVEVDAPLDARFKAVQTRIKISLSGDITATPLKDRNVLGMVAGEDTTRCIIVGAHYDHHGMFNGVLYPGADDNASGTAGIMMLAKALKESGIKPKVNIIFALWTGEEKGLIGSTYYARNPIFPLDRTGMYVNYDMIGRNAAEDTARLRAHFFFLDKLPRIKEIVEANNAKLGGILRLSNAPTEGGYWSDHGPFYERNVPFMGWAAGNHPDYHKPTDTADKIDPEKIQRITKLSFLNMLDLAKEFGENR